MINLILFFIVFTGNAYEHQPEDLGWLYSTIDGGSLTDFLPSQGIFPATVVQDHEQRAAVKSTRLTLPAAASIVQKRAEENKHKASPLRNGTNAQQFVLEESYESIGGKRFAEENEQKAVTAALKKLNYDFSKGMPSKEELKSDQFWLRLHFAEHDRITARYET